MQTLQELADLWGQCFYRVSVKPEPCHYHLVIFQAGIPAGNPLVSVSRSMVAVLQDQMDEKITTPPEETSIDVWIESPGGDAHAAYKLFVDLKSRANSIRVAVPDYAKSAATLLALGADVIFMKASAELGPIDAQIEHPDREHYRVSALEVAFSIDYLARFATHFIGRYAGPMLIDSTKLSRLEILRELCDFSAKFLEPAVSKLDPTLVHRASKQLKVARDYAMTILSHSKATQLKRDSREYIEDLVEHLTHDYSEHGFVISRNEAKNLGLPIEPLEGHLRWPQIKRLLREYERSIDRDPVILLCLSDSEIDSILPPQAPKRSED